MRGLGNSNARIVHSWVGMPPVGGSARRVPLRVAIVGEADCAGWKIVWRQNVNALIVRASRRNGQCIEHRLRTRSSERDSVGSLRRRRIESEGFPLVRGGKRTVSRNHRRKVECRRARTGIGRCRC